MRSVILSLAGLRLPADPGRRRSWTTMARPMAMDASDDAVDALSAIALGRGRPLRTMVANELLLEEHGAPDGHDEGDDAVEGPMAIWV
jgi:hypothetical protein